MRQKATPQKRGFFMAKIMKKLTVGIVGDGRFATILRRLFLRSDFILLQSSRRLDVDNRTIFSLVNVLNADIVFLCIPISQLENFLQNNVHLIKNRKSLCIDVCSVKIKPAEWMQKLLPGFVDILATHPVFGPVSSKNGTLFENLLWVFSPIRINNTEIMRALFSFLDEQKLHRVTMTTEEHDHVMSRSQSVAFLFGSLASRMKLRSSSLDTNGFKMILENQRIVESDSSQLFHDMLHFNPFMKEVLRDFKNAAAEVLNEFGV
jgi:prephenate dehydrogenase